MCYFVSVNFTKNEIEKGLGAEFDDTSHYEPNFYFNAFSLPRVPVICNDKADKIQMYQWGLIPFWAKDEEYANKIRFSTFNAKAETITQKPSFKSPVKNKRCIVICNGFFEWQTVNNKKFPYYIQLKEEGIMTLAGIYDSWLNKNTGEIINTFSVITTTANSLVEKIHNVKKRMPVILGNDGKNTWLNRDIPLLSALEVLKPFNEEEMKAHTVSPLISTKDVEKNVPDLIKPYQYPGLDL